ncbi:MAG: hypothetical protein KC474_02925, partial [Cyanobacteria bacterium HKST-UBA04]|nr:hypothetical protein [Cyanobacteria bacterium HKST-UBA04]
RCMKRSRREFVGLKHLLSAQSALAVDATEADQDLRLTPPRPNKTAQPVRPPQGEPLPPVPNIQTEPQAEPNSGIQTESPPPATDTVAVSSPPQANSDRTDVDTYDSSPKLPQKYTKTVRSKKARDLKRRSPKADADIKPTTPPLPATDTVLPEATASKPTPRFAPDTDATGPVSLHAMRTLRSLRAAITEAVQTMRDTRPINNASSATKLLPRQTVSSALLVSSLLIGIVGLLTFCISLPPTLPTINQLLMALGLSMGLFALRYLLHTAPESETHKPGA